MPKRVLTFLAVCWQWTAEVGDALWAERLNQSAGLFAGRRLPAV